MEQVSAQQPSSPRMGAHFPALDGFRGCAALAVVAFHYYDRAGMGAVGKLFSVGWTGVDAFFVLSGFLITGILYKQRGTRSYYKNFYARRALRLFPLYYFILLLAFVASWFTAPHWHPIHFAFLFYAANIAMTLSQSYGLLGIVNINHFWTLALEEQFYLAWPWLVGSRISRRTLIWICALGIVGALALRILLAPHHSLFLLYYNLPTRMDSLLIGALIALVPLPKKLFATVVALGSAMLFLFVAHLDNTLYFIAPHISRYGYSLAGIFYGALLILALHDGWVNRFFALRPLRWVGRLSYGLYLWHFIFGPQIIQWIFRLQLHVHPAALASTIGFVAPLTVSLCVAWLSYRFLEQPFLRLKKKYE